MYRRILLCLAVLVFCAAPIRAVAEQSEPIAQCTTYYNPQNTARSHNISLAVAAIDGLVIPPSAEFSYNDAIGPTIKSRGYKKARVFQNGRERKNYGGGVCQVSSTLYNAALDLDLEILERHPHSRAVGYLPEGLDAATFYGSLDLRFLNTTPFSLLITATADHGDLTVSLTPLP